MAHALLMELQMLAVNSINHLVKNAFSIDGQQDKQLITHSPFIN